MPLLIQSFVVLFTTRVSFCTNYLLCTLIMFIYFFSIVNCTVCVLSSFNNGSKSVSQSAIGSAYRLSDRYLPPVLERSSGRAASCGDPRHEDRRRLVSPPVLCRGRDYVLPLFQITNDFCPIFAKFAGLVELTFPTGFSSSLQRQFTCV